MVESRTKPPPLWVRQCSVAGTNMKVGAPRKWGGDRSDGKKIGRAPTLFFGSKGTISRFGERFHDGHYSLVSRPSLFAVFL